ncbi:MAG: Na/Pi cotransporter family protein [Clostridia bacterium]|nr:Na/Pi cotransporter family protein [Clostridia bacterium]
MDIFDILSLVGGLSLFLFGMNIMGQALERRAGSGLRNLLEKLTSKWYTGLLTGLAVTAVIQSSSATTVMVVGFVNSGVMKLRHAINVIMGANIGTTVTAWILSLAGIEGDNLFIKLLKPTSFTPVLAVIGIVMTMFLKSNKNKDTGTILLGFATLMFGMDTMSNSVEGLANVPEFANLFLLFENPILGVVVGAVVTAIIQSSSASVGILQALSATGKVSIGATIPIIMGQNIGTCITAMLSSFGANRNAKRAATVHLTFNIIGTSVMLAIYSAAKYVFSPAVLMQNANELTIAMVHSIFNIACTVLLLPFAGALEKLVTKLIPDAKEQEVVNELDERLLATPPLALNVCHKVTAEMADGAVQGLKKALGTLQSYSSSVAEEIRELEDKTDKYEDKLGSYLVKLSSAQVTDADSTEAAKLLKVIGDFERISDHSLNIVESAEEMRDKKIMLTDAAAAELNVVISAVEEITDLAHKAFIDNDIESAYRVEPLEQIIDDLKETLRTNHILRMQQGNCSIDAGFIWSDLLTNLERISDHCSNIAGCVIDMAQNDMSFHKVHKEFKYGSDKYKELYTEYTEKYTIA